MSRSTFWSGPFLIGPWVLVTGTAAGMGHGLMWGIAATCTLAYWAVAWASFPNA